jgi:hypothetical protein
MHDIKYFFSMKLIRQFKGAKKNYRGQITEKHYFSKSRETGARLIHSGSALVANVHEW